MVSTPTAVQRRDLPRFNSCKQDEEHSTDAETLIADGIQAMHENLATIVTNALGTSIPSMDIRFNNLHITATETFSTLSKGFDVPNLLTPLKTLGTKVLGKSHVVEKEILRGITGTFKPGRLTLVLGLPGSGKSSLMKILSGRFPVAKNITVNGDILYNNHTRQDLQDSLSRYVVYVDQEDHHYGRLTVRETFDFAHTSCSGNGLPDWMTEVLSRASPEQYEAAVKALMDQHRLATDLMLKYLDLEHVQHELVGDSILPSKLTPSEQKRVTIGEMAFGIKAVHFVDELDDGMDNQSTLKMVQALKSLARYLNRTVVLSLHSPSPDVYALFDDVLVLQQGYVVYQGPRQDILPYFKSLGFTCPPRKQIIDFILELGTSKQARYCLNSNQVPCTASEFAQRYQLSTVCHEFQKMGSPRPILPLLPSSETHQTRQHQVILKPFRQTFLEDIQLVLARQWLLTKRNKVFVFGRTCMVLLMGLLYGTSFWQLQDNNSQLVLGLLFSCSMFLALGQAAHVPVFLQARHIFYKQRGANFYRTISYVIASCIAQIPFALMETLCFGSMLYWMGGYVNTMESFLLFLMTLFLCQICFTSFFFFLSSSIPKTSMATPCMMISILLFTLFAGFLITKSNIPSWISWFYWINPMAWCIRALSINEYTASKFQHCIYQQINYCKLSHGKFSTFGAYALNTFDLEADRSWIFYSWCFFIVSYIGMMMTSTFWLEWKRYEGPETKRAEIPIEEQEVYHLHQDDVALGIPQNGTNGFIPVTLAFQDIWYSCPVFHTIPRDAEDVDLICGISGFALSGTMTALMGPRGSGKTTLLNILAQRTLVGNVRGEIYLNGHVANRIEMQQISGYCEPIHIHSESATIREAMIFSAVLRQDASISHEAKLEMVEQHIELLGLTSLANTMIRGSSKALMKRISIAVELMANPSLLFIDEPTNGLDPQSSFEVMQGLRHVANTGRTIICTIHEPSTDVFTLFHSVLLLQRGGHVAFFGETNQVVEYFETIPGIDRLEVGYNVATWMTKTLNTMDLGTYYVSSTQRKMIQQDMKQDGVTRPSRVLPAISYQAKRSVSPLIQFQYLALRSFRMHWRSPVYNITRFILSIILAGLYGMMYHGTKYETFRGANAGIGMIFLSTAIFGIILFNGVIPVAIMERAAFYRERECQTYHVLYYFIATTLTEIPYVFFLGLVFTSIFFPAVGFTGWTSFLIYWVILSLHLLLQVYIGQFFAYLLPNAQAASGLGGLLTSIWLLFAGFNPPASKIPSLYKWLYYASPPSYTISALSATIFSQCNHPHESTRGCQPLQNVSQRLAGITLKGYIEKIFLMKHDEIWTNVMVIYGLTVLFRVLGLIALRYIKYHKH